MTEIYSGSIFISDRGQLRTAATNPYRNEQELHDTLEQHSELLQGVLGGMSTSPVLSVEPTRIRWKAVAL